MAQLGEVRLMIEARRLYGEEPALSEVKGNPLSTVPKRATNLDPGTTGKGTTRADQHQKKETGLQPLTYVRVGGTLLSVALDVALDF